MALPWHPPSGSCCSMSQRRTLRSPMPCLFSGFSGDYLVTTCGCRLNLSAFNCKGKGRNSCFSGDTKATCVPVFLDGLPGLSMRAQQRHGHSLKASNLTHIFSHIFCWMGGHTCYRLWTLPSQVPVGETAGHGKFHGSRMCSGR